MPKQPTEPLYNHKARPFVSRQINVDVAGTTGHRNVSLTSNLIAPTSLPLPVLREPDELFPVPMDVDDDLGAVEGEGDSSETATAVPALPGVHVVPKERAKRYENSVH
jgi:hypothetical protein